MSRVLPLVFASACIALVAACSGGGSRPEEAEAAGAEADVAAIHADLRIACNEAALRGALARVAAAGGGRVTLDCRNTTIDIADQIVFRGSNLTLDGEDRRITFRYAGPDPCDQTEGLDRFLEIYGDRNVIRNLSLERFPEGIHFQSGDGNVAENLRFPIVCEDAITNGAPAMWPRTPLSGTRTSRSPRTRR
jgi:hypothetical protein